MPDLVTGPPLTGISIGGRVKLTGTTFRLLRSVEKQGLDSSERSAKLYKLPRRPRLNCLRAGCVRSLRTQQRAHCQMPKTSCFRPVSSRLGTGDSFGNRYINNKASQSGFIRFGLFLSVSNLLPRHPIPGAGDTRCAGHLWSSR